MRYRFERRSSSYASVRAIGVRLGLVMLVETCRGYKVHIFTLMFTLLYERQELMHEVTLATFNSLIKEVNMAVTRGSNIRLKYARSLKHQIL